MRNIKLLTTLKSIKKRLFSTKEIESCSTCRFNCEDDPTVINDCNVGSYYAEKDGINVICYIGELYEPKNNINEKT